AGIFRRRTVRWFEYCIVVAKVRARGETKSTDQTRAQIAHDVAEHVFRDEHRIILRVLEHPHADRVDVRVVRANVGITFRDVFETAHHQSTGFTLHVRLFNQRHAFAAGLLRELERLFADAGATLHAHNPR